MMKLFERPKIHENPEILEPHDHLPDLPADVIVPDDISGMEFPTRRPKTVRWLRWVPVGLVLVAGSADPDSASE